MGKAEILSTRNVFCQKRAAVCQKIEICIFLTLIFFNSWNGL